MNDRYEGGSAWALQEHKLDKIMKKTRSTNVTKFVKKKFKNIPSFT